MSSTKDTELFSQTCLVLNLFVAALQVYVSQLVYILLVDLLTIPAKPIATFQAASGHLLKDVSRTIAHVPRTTVHVKNLVRTTNGMVGQRTMLCHTGRRPTVFSAYSQPVRILTPTPQIPNGSHAAKVILLTVLKSTVALSTMNEEKEMEVNEH